MWLMARLYSSLQSQMKMDYHCLCIFGDRVLIGSPLGFLAHFRLSHGGESSKVHRHRGSHRSNVRSVLRLFVASEAHYRCATEQGRCTKHDKVMSKTIVDVLQRLAQIRFRPCAHGIISLIIMLHTLPITVQLATINVQLLSRSFTLMPRAPFQLLRSVFSINRASVASWSSRSAGGPSENGAVLCDELGAMATGPELGGPLWKGLLNRVVEGVWALNAGEGWIEGEVTAERTDAEFRE